MTAGSATIHARHALLPGGWAGQVRLSIADGLVAGVASGCEPAPGDLRCGAIVPGMANLHSHAFQRAMAGLAERREGQDSFWTWREAMYRLVARIDPAQLAAIAALAYCEMLECGFTRVAEFHYLHHDRDGTPFADRAEMAHAIVTAAAETGIGLTLLPVFYARSGFAGEGVSASQRRFASDPDTFAALLEATRAAAAGLPGTVVGIAPHSLRAVSPAELRALVPLAGAGPLHIHVAEQRREVEECLALRGRRPVEWLLDTGLVDARWCLVHATHMTGEECTALAATGAVAGLCPITEANLGDGLFPAEAFLAAGGAFGIGSDSNVRIDLAEELRLLEYGQRLVTNRRSVLASDAAPSTGERLFAAALAGGARASGIAPPALAAGSRADLVSLDLDHPSLAGASAGKVLDAWIFAAGAGAIDGVWQAGRQVVRGGRHVARAGIAARYRKALEDLRA